jgi:hypothetical protein
MSPTQRFQHWSERRYAMVNALAAPAPFVNLADRAIGFDDTLAG